MKKRYQTQQGRSLANESHKVGVVFMSDFDAESLSALLDNEADDLSIPRVLESYEDNPDIVEKWRRYNLVQAAIHGDVVQVSPNLRKGVHESVKEKSNPDRFEISFFETNC